MNVVDLLRAIPEGIWGVILGSLLAFGGTFVATRRQLRHDAQQRALDRKMQLRREVFLEAAEGVAGTDYFVKLANADLPPAELSMSTSKPGWLNKLYTVGSLDAIEAFSIASAALGAAAIDLLRSRMSIDDVKTKINTASYQIEAMKAVQQRIRDAAVANPVDGSTAEGRQLLETMRQHWEFAHREIERLGADVATLSEEKFRRQWALLERAIEYSLDYQKKLRRALVVLRLELDFPLDHDKLEAVMDRIDAEMLPKFKKLLDAMARDSNTPAV
jgi:hypothetical protein